MYYPRECLFPERLCETLIRIGDDAFKGCSGLTELYLPSSVREVGYSAFGDCKGLRCVSLSEGLELRGKGVFARSGGKERIKLNKRVRILDLI